MARFLIGTVSAVGHINPVLPIARELVECGHEVWWYTGIAFKSTIEAIGQKAQLISADMAHYDTPTLAANLLEQLVATKQPVLRV